MDLTDPNSRIERSTRGFPHLFFVIFAVFVLVLWPLGRVPYGWWFPAGWAVIGILSLKRLVELWRLDHRSALNQNADD